MRYRYGPDEGRTEGIDLHQADGSDQQEEEEENNVERVLSVDGMMCQNCVKHVTHALENIDGSSNVRVILDENKAYVTVPDTVSDDVLKKAVIDAGYGVTSIEAHES